MGDGTKLIKVMDKMSKGQLGDTADFVMGTVLSISPLQIRVGDKTVLTNEFITLSPMCVEKTIDLNHTHSYSGTTGDAAPGPHNHTYGGSVDQSGPGTAGVFTVWRGIIAGDLVLMLKSKGGQRYYVLQRLEGL